MNLPAPPHIIRAGMGPPASMNLSVPSYYSRPNGSPSGYEPKFSHGIRVGGFPLTRSRPRVSAREWPSVAGAVVQRASSSRRTVPLTRREGRFT